MNCKHTTCPLLEISLIPLTQGEFAIVDTEDYDWLMQRNWTAVLHKNGRWYARSGGGRHAYMHQHILSSRHGECADHANHDGLDNRKCNLRICTKSQNMQNCRARTDGKSMFKGVSWDKYKKKWIASIGWQCKTYTLGRFSTEIGAAMAYNKRAKELFGKFANLNILREKQ